MCGRILGRCPVRLWGLTSEERLLRQLDKAGVQTVADPEDRTDRSGSVVFLRADYLFDARTIQDLVARPGTLLETASGDGGSIGVAAHVAADLAPAAERWLTGAGAYIATPLAGYASLPIWTSDPKHTPYRDPVKNMRPAGYAGKLGYASAGAAADFIVINMVAEAVSGSKTPKEAMERAQKRAERYYKV